VVSFAGYVEVEHAATQAREAVARTPRGLSPGDKVHTGRGGRATVQFRDGSQVALGPYAIFTVEKETLRETTIFLTAGKLWAAVAKNAQRRFSVRTHTAVAAVRGTEFSVEVQTGRRTAVEVFGGLVAVRGALGTESMVSASQRVDITEGRNGQVERFSPRPESVPEALRPAMFGPAAGGEGGPDGDDHSAQQGPHDGEDGKRRDRHRGPDGEAMAAFDPERFKDFVEHQAGEQVMRDQRESQAIFEHKAELYQDGKTLIDAFGRRVRVEEHLLRPTADSFRFISLSFRDNRTDLASVEVTANQALPERLADAGNLWFSPGAPTYWAVRQRLTMTNGLDSVVELGVDGAPQLHTISGEPVFDPGTNSFITGSFSFYRTMFGNKYEFINGNAAAIADIYHGAFRPKNNGEVSGNNTVSGMMWRTQPVKVQITDINNPTNVRGSYWTDAFVKYSVNDGLAFAQTTYQPTPGAAHFVSQRSYFNFRDSNNNDILDFGEQLDPSDPNSFHDVVGRMNGNAFIGSSNVGTKEALGDTLVFSDLNGTGIPTANPQATITYPTSVGPTPLSQALTFAQGNARASLTADEFAVDDFGSVLGTNGGFNDSAALFSGANFERRLRSSLFSGPDIDVVMSPAFIFQSGASNASEQDRPVPSPGPRF
jgi:hypothetical protein